MLPTYKVYLAGWSQDIEIYGKVTDWNDMCKLNDLHAYDNSRAVNCFMFAAIRPKDSALFPYVEPRADLHKYSHIPELTSDQVNQLIFIHSLDH